MNILVGYMKRYEFFKLLPPLLLHFSFCGSEWGGGYDKAKRNYKSIREMSNVYLWKLQTVNKNKSLSFWWFCLGFFLHREHLVGLVSLSCLKRAFFGLSSCLLFVPVVWFEMSQMLNRCPKC
jgi:hypothetical protein